MKIKVVGAAGGEVTGSAYFVQTDRAQILIDAGMFQGGKGSEVKNRIPAGVSLPSLDAVLLTHAHLDHTGRIPLLIKRGFRSGIFATGATIDLTELILKDSAKIQVQDAERANRRAGVTKAALLEPLYGPADVTPFRSMAREVRFHEPVEVAPSITARWIEAGHMLGSASIELVVAENGRQKRIVFSGDLGPTSRPIVRDFESPGQADLVFLESTYGDRDHRPYPETVAEFESIVKECVAQGGKMLVPSFAIGRSQQILYHLAIMFKQKMVKPFPVFLDSPMAIEASKYFMKYPDLFDDEMVGWQSKGLLPLNPAWFHATPTAKESQALNKIKGPSLIIAGAGMCNAGRILHHLHENVSQENTHVLIVGFQGKGSLGRQLVEGAKTISIRGDKLTVRPRVHTLNGFSAHAGQTDLLKWVSAEVPFKPRILLTHGEDKARNALSSAISEKFGLPSELPKLGEVVEL
jgi:metallo-beta-lactamase family protein